ncbi:MAG: chemotaxis protein CheR [Clostridia bacterium]|nr:chemotaxis protein CheR [Clostridia bacterium]
MSNRFTEHHYTKLYDIISQRYGIQYGREKKDILLSRVDKAMRRNGIQDYDTFVSAIVLGRPAELIQDFINTITVNKTDFFRESQHFDYILQHVQSILAHNPAIMEAGEIRAWSAASSTGEEPYTLAMVLKEAFSEQVNVKVLATDIDTSVLSKAQRGIYPIGVLNDIPRAYALKYFFKTGEYCGVKQEIKDLVSFRSFNLMNDFPFRKKFDIVFCRNVMIYFNKNTQSELISRIYNALNEGGLLFTGHSEALPNKSLRLKYVSPAIYMKY